MNALKACVCLLFVCLSGNLFGQVNVARFGSIIDGSGAWNQEAFTNGLFPAPNVIDGAVNEGADENTMWLGREGLLNEYFTLDLGSPIAIDTINLYNTHNRQFDDRGTNEFVIYMADGVDGSNQLLDQEVLFSGELADVSGQNPIIGEEFEFAPVTTQYLKFEALTSTYGNNNVGLNEIEVFATGNFEPPNKALNRPVINGSGSWDGGAVGVGAPFNGGSFPASSVTDGSRDDAAGNYWLGREGTPDYFVLDLEREVDIKQITLRNTHNNTSHDRGTQDFEILASNEVDVDNELVNPISILSSSLYNTTGVSPSFANVFTAENGLSELSARYLHFQSIDGTYFNGNVGLNEIEVYEEVLAEATEPPRYNENIALNKPVIDGSGSWNQLAFEDPTAQFPARFVTDGSIADHSAAPSQHWLASEFCPGPDCVDGPDAESYFTIDLGDLYRVDEISLRNTHNRQFNDRGTEEFVIFGAEEVDENGQLIDPVPVLAGELARTDGMSPIPAESFTEDEGLTVSEVRYLKFRALSAYSTLETGANGGAGLNEIEVYGQLVGDLGGGDFNGDGEYDCADLDALYVAIAGGDTLLDLTGDGNVDGADLDAWLSEAGAAKGFTEAIRKGDADLNGLVNAEDLNVVGINWQMDGLTSWCQGDFNHDGSDNAMDLNNVGINWLSDITSAAAPVPEPSGLFMGLLGCLALLLRRPLRRRGN